jgi:hypothetical protein
MVRLLVLAVLVAWTPAASAQTERAAAALKSLFPEATQFTPKDVFLTDEAAARLQSLARTKISERMVTFYVATAGDHRVVGYAAMHTHKVRTKNETLVVGFEPTGAIRRIDLAVFLEPEEYLPPQAWLAQFNGKSSADRLTVGDDLLVITGATLSARNIAETARWLLVALKEAGLAPPRAP